MVALQVESSGAGVPARSTGAARSVPRVARGPSRLITGTCACRDACARPERSRAPMSARPSSVPRTTQPEPRHQALHVDPWLLDLPGHGRHVSAVLGEEPGQTCTDLLIL